MGRSNTARRRFLDVADATRRTRRHRRLFRLPATSPARGDLVIFEIPPTRRLTARSSSTGRAEKEPYIVEPWTMDKNWPRDGSDVTVPSGQYFVLLDNRNLASDSRGQSFIALDAIAGRILLNGSTTPST